MRSALTRLLLAALLTVAPGIAFAQSAGGLPADVLRIVTPITVGDCLEIAKNTVPYAAGDTGSPCGSGGGGGGTVTSFSFVNGNGLNGIVTNATTTPSLSLSPSFTGFAYSNGTGLSAASTTGSGNLVLANSPTLVSPALGTPTVIDLTNGTGLPFSGLTTGTLGSGVLTVGTGATLTYSGTGVLNANQIGSLAWPTPISGDCLTTSGTALLWGTCGGAGTSFQVNGTATAASNPINFLNSAATDGLTLTFANPSAGDVQLGLTGTLSTAGGGTGLSALTEYSLLSGGASTANLIAPSATVGEALISNGTAAQPGYSASLAGVTSVNGTSIPAAATLLYSGGPLGTPSSGTLTNATGLPLSTGVTGILGIGNGGTGVSSTPTNGELLIGNGSGYALGAIQGSTNVTVTNGAGSISLALPVTITSSTSGNAATATALAASPTQCSGAVATGIAASGNANCTPTPTLGASGTLGSVTLGNATSGTVTLAPVTGALGTVTASLPANTGTLAELNLAQTWSALQTFGTDISIGGVTPTGATGTGALVFGTSPTLTTPALGTPSAVVLTNGTGLPLTTGVTGLLPVANGGTGTATPSLVAGTNITISGTWPDQTVTASGGSGTVTTTGTPTAGSIAAFSGSTSITNATPSQVLSLVNSQTCDAQTGTTYTFAITDANSCVTMSNTAANTVTVPPNPISAPVQSAATTSTTGGTLAAGTYYYVVTALTSSGQTTASNEESVTTTGTTSSNTITWAAVTGASGYDVYRGTTAGGENVYYSVGNVTTYVDTNATSTSGTPPASNTSGVSYPVGTTLTTVQIGTGATTVAPGTSVALDSAKYGSSTTQTYVFPAEYSCLALQKTATDTWFVSSCDYNPGSGSGTVTDGSGTTTANELAVSTTTAHTIGYAATLPTAAMPALTGDLTGTAGSLSVTVSKVNGGAIPASATALASNASSQIVAASTVTYLLDEGTTFTIASGTGACATTGTLKGGTTVGSFVCSGTAGAATVVITLPSAPNGIWVCKAFDSTTVADTVSETAYTATSITLTASTLGSGDTITFGGCTGS